MIIQVPRRLAAGRYLIFFLLLVVIVIILYLIIKKRKQKKVKAKLREFEKETPKIVNSIKETIHQKKIYDSSEIVIKLVNLTKKFGNLTAVDNINLEVHRGETIGLVGPNGAGKTTTIKMIAKILRPTSGKILIRTDQQGLQDLQKISRTISHMGFLIDIPTFYDMTADQVLRYFANLQNYPKEKIDGRIEELLTLFKLEGWRWEKVKTFSKGMTQKLGVIQAIIHDPEIVILDEPQTGLDPIARIEIRKYIRELQDHGKTIFVASHLLHEISEVCDKIALINNGSIIGFDTVDNLEGTLKIKSIECKVLDPILPENLGPIINKLTEKLNLYLDKNLDPDISKIPVKYDPKNQRLVIYYDGKKESRGEILKKLIKEFETDFTIISYTKPEVSRLERIYSQMITESMKITQANIRRKD
ncbi:MAG: ABC transporter ATP-binding protein [Promethearchaeota archaeon]